MEKTKFTKKLKKQSTLEHISKKTKNYYKNTFNNNSVFELINENNTIYSFQCPIKNYVNDSNEKYNNPLTQKNCIFRPILMKSNDGYNSPTNNFSKRNKIGRSPDELERKMKNIYMSDRCNIYKTDSTKYNNSETNEIMQNLSGNLFKNNFNNYKKNLIIQTTNKYINNISDANKNIEKINNSKIINIKNNIVNRYFNNDVEKKISKKNSMNDFNDNYVQKLQPEIKKYLPKKEVEEKINKKNKVLLQNDFNKIPLKEKNSSDQIQNNNRNKEKLETSKTSTIQKNFYKKLIKPKENDQNYNSLLAIRKQYSNSNKFLDDNISNQISNSPSNKNILVKRNVSLIPKKKNKIINCNSNKELVADNLKSLNEININNNMKINNSRKNSIKCSPPIIKKNKIVRKVYLKPNDNLNNINNINYVDNSKKSSSNLKINLNINNTINENRLKSPETQKIYQKPKKTKTNQKKTFICKIITPDKKSENESTVKPFTIDNKINNYNNGKMVFRNKYHKIKEISSGTEDSYKFENKNDLDSSNDYLSRLIHLKENLCNFTDKVVNKKYIFISKYYNFFLDKQAMNNPCYFTKKYFKFKKLPKIKNCFFSKNNEIIYTKKKNDTNCYYTKIRKLVKPITKMPVDDICVFSKNILYDRFKKKPKSKVITFNDNITNNENILIKPTKNKKRKKRRKTRRLHKMTEKEIEEQKLNQKNENDNKDNNKEDKTDDDEDEKICEENNNNNNLNNSNLNSNLNNNNISMNNSNNNNSNNNNNNNISKNLSENEKSITSKNEIKSNIQPTSSNKNNNKSKLKSPILRKNDNQSSILSEIEINLGDIEKNQLKNYDVVFSYEDGYKENEDFHIESDEEDEEEKSIKKRNPKTMGRIKNSFDVNDKNKITVGKEIIDDNEFSPYKKTNYGSSGKTKDSGGYLMLRRQKLMKMIENIQKKRDKITKIHNYNIANQKKLMAFNKLSEIFNINDKKQKLGLAINKIEEIIGKKTFRNEENDQENKTKNNIENNISNINKYKEIFELNPIKKLELIMNKQVNNNNITNSNSENNNTTSENKNNTPSENNNITNSDNNIYFSNQFLSEINNTNSFNNTTSNIEKKYTYEEILSLRNSKFCLKNNLLSVEVIRHCTEILKEVKILSPKNSILKSADFVRANIRKCSTDNTPISQWARKDMTKEISQAEKYVQDLNKNLLKNVFKHKIIEILNTLTVDNYNNILNKLIEIIFLGEKENKNKLLKTEYLLHNQSIFVEIILDKATMEKSYVILYAKLCADLYTELLRLINDYINHEIKNQLINGENLKTILIGECQQRFDEININSDLIINNENFASSKKKFLGNLNFIAELINVKIISQTLGFNYLNLLYKRYKEMSENPKIKFLNLEGAVILLGKFGKIVSDRRNPKHIQNLDDFINDKLFPILSNNEKDLPNYLKYKIINLIEKKKNNWKDSLYENSINAKGKYCNFIVNSDEDVEENGDKIIIDESFDEYGFNKDNGVNGNEDEEKMKEDNIIILLKEDIENYISFLNENNIFNKKDIEDYFIQNDNYDINNEYNWTVVNELIVKLKIELEEIIRCYIEVCIDYITKENIIFYVNEYIKNIINYYGLDLSSNDINRFHSSMIKLFLNIEDVCVDNRYMWEIMGFLLSVLITDELYNIEYFNKFSDKDRGTLEHVSNVLKFCVAYFEGDNNKLIEKIKNLDIFKKNKDLFIENIVEPLKNKYGMSFDE